MEPLTRDLFRLASCRAQVLCEPDGSAVDRASGELAGRFEKLFDAPPSRIDPSTSVSPLLRLRSADLTWRLEIWEDRSALVWNRPTPEGSAPSLQQFCTRAAEILGEVTSWRRTRAHGMGALIEHIGWHPTPGPVLSHQLFSPRLANVLASPAGLLVETQERRKLGSFDVHSIQRFRAGAKLANMPQRALVAQQELGTVLEDATASFSPADITAFMAGTHKHIDGVLDYLYPNLR